ELLVGNRHQLPGQLGAQLGLAAAFGFIRFGLHLVDTSLSGYSSNREREQDARCNEFPHIVSRDHFTSFISVHCRGSSLLRIIIYWGSSLFRIDGYQTLALLKLLVREFAVCRRQDEFIDCRGRFPDIQVVIPSLP